MGSFVPNNVPQLTRESAEAYFKRFLANGLIGDKRREEMARMPVRLLGIRGYYLNSMGKVGENDRGIYDDAICVLSPDAFHAFNANVDPSRVRNGQGYGAGKGMASLREGLWLYRPGIHGLSKPASKQYPAFVQAEAVCVLRDAAGADYTDIGKFGINIHRGGSTTTSSEGCQTIYPSQWNAFYGLTRAEMESHGQAVIPYLLAPVAQ